MGLGMALRVILSFLSVGLHEALASMGDRSRMFYDCVKDCLAENCSGKISSILFFKNT